MKANEFVKKFGLKRVFEWINSDLGMVHNYIIKDGGYWVCYSNQDQKGAVLINDLKRLVESHELVENFKCKRYSGISNAKDHLLTLAHIEDYEKLNKLRQAILDVESCQ